MPAHKMNAAPSPAGPLPCGKGCSGPTERAASPNSPFLLSTATEQGLAAGQSLSTSEESSSSWSSHDSEKLYSVAGWGAPYFAVGDSGQLCVHPQADSATRINLYGLIRSLKEQGLQTPCLFRFPDIVNHRVTLLQGCFDRAISRYDYQGAFRGVFPVKCNHSRDLLESILEFGQRRYGFGLEAGSKAELLLAMSMLSQYPGSNLVCNGYKDAEYMELVLQCRQLGINAIVILEQLHELDTLLRVSASTGVTPVIGVRAKLATRHAGHWGATSGDRAKFGLRPAEIVSVIQMLSGRGMLGCLQLLHFHVGSQITNIRVVKEAMQEAAYMFAELTLLGAPMAYLDVGGGLAIDYDGSKTDTVASLSYTMQQYANDVVATIQEVCTMRSIPVPTILSESGRALASHHAVMVFDVLTRPPQEDVALGNSNSALLGRKLHTTKGRFLLMTAQETLDNLDGTQSAGSLNEAYADAAFFKEDALRAFKLGVLSLQERAEIDRLFDLVCRRICNLAAATKLPLPQPLQPETRPHSSMYHINLSVFRSAVDIWAIDQLFPIMPLHRLEEEPEESATLADITCDSDGKIDRFISPDGGQPLPVLPVHKLVEGEEYLLGMFLGGVYQEVMGSAHNMLGSTHIVHVKASPGSVPAFEPGAFAGDGAVAPSPDGKLVGDGFVIDRLIRGESIQEVLMRSNHQGETMFKEIQEAAATAVREERLDPAAAKDVARSFARRLSAYTYLTGS